MHPALPAQVVDIPNSMTVLPEMIPASVDLARQSLTGTLNFTNPGVLSHNQVLRLYQEHIDPSFTWQNFSEEEQAEVLKAPRSNNELDTAALSQLCPTVLPLRASLVKHVFRPNSRLAPPR